MFLYVISRKDKIPKTISGYAVPLRLRWYQIYLFCLQITILWGFDFLLHSSFGIRIDELYEREKQFGKPDKKWDNKAIISNSSWVFSIYNAAADGS